MHKFFEYQVDQIDSVEYLGEIETDWYDIGMDDTPHTFFANDLLVHNSTFLSALPVIKHRHPDIDQSDYDQMIQKTVEIATETQDYINASYETLTRLIFHSDNNKLKIKQENVALSGIWLAKKRYAQWMLYKEGTRVEELDVKGIDIIRSDYPVTFKETLSNIVTSMLKEDDKNRVDNIMLDFIEKLSSFDLDNIMFNVGVKNLEDYSQGRTPFNAIKGTPIGVKSALNYNDILEKTGKSNYGLIRSKDKIKWCYLKPNPYNIDTVALKHESNPTEVVEFVEKYIDRLKMIETRMIEKTQDFYNAMNWGRVPTNITTGKFFSF